MNRISMWSYDTRPFAMHVRMVRRLSVADVRRMLPPHPTDEEAAFKMAVKRAAAAVKVTWSSTQGHAPPLCPKVGGSTPPGA
eukprot:6752068-Pyramimonas_sp.AAC.1